MRNKIQFENTSMLEALKQAKIAFNKSEVPVGCVISNKYNGKIISKAYNLMQMHNNPNFHSEILAINNACKYLGTKTLSDYNIYVTLEPCTMCACAISHAKLSGLYYGASDAKHGAVENGVRFYNSTSCFHKPDVYHGINEIESITLLKRFFYNLRYENN